MTRQFFAPFAFSLFLIGAPIVGSCYVPGHIHALTDISYEGDEFRLEDGSRWKVVPYDRWKLRQWQPNDPLVIFQNTWWFFHPTQDYRIVNKRDNSSVNVELFRGPRKNGEFTRYITDIDYTRRLILLTDNTHWEVHEQDQASLRDWTVGDPVILGRNARYDDYWDRSEGMLIDVREPKKFVRVHQY